MDAVVTVSEIGFNTDLFVWVNIAVEQKVIVEKTLVFNIFGVVQAVVAKPCLPVKFFTGFEVITQFAPKLNQ